LAHTEKMGGSVSQNVGGNQKPERDKGPQNVWKARLLKNWKRSGGDPVKPTSRKSTSVHVINNLVGTSVGRAAGVRP